MNVVFVLRPSGLPLLTSVLLLDDWLECLINISGGGVGLHAVLTLIKKSSRILFYMSLELMQ